jgi:hypothetical protein
MFFQHCDKTTVKSEAEKVGDLLKANTWKIQSVQVDGVDQTKLFDGLTLSFGEGTYTAANGQQVWPASGTWKWVDNTGKSFTRQDNVVVSVASASATGLVLGLSWSQTSLVGGRANSIAGNHTFVFAK